MKNNNILNEEVSGNRCTEYNIDNTDSLFEICKISNFNDLKIQLKKTDKITNRHIVLWFLKGSGQLSLDFEEYEIRDNSIFFVSPSSLIMIKDEESAFRGFCILFTKDFLDNMGPLFSKYMINNFWGATIHTSYCQLKEQQTVNLLLVHLYKLINESTGGQQQFVYYSALVSELTSFFIVIIRKGEWKNHVHEKYIKSALINYRNFIDAVEKNYKNVHEVRQYAEKLHISMSTLKTSIRTVKDKRPLEIIDDRIITEAKRLLKTDGEMSVSQVASELGFSELSNFAKFFKRHAGISPTNFRDRKK